MDSASLLLEIEKKISFWVCGSLEGTSQVGVFCVFSLMLPGPGRQPNEPFFGSSFFYFRVSSESLEPLVGFLAYLEPKLWIKKQKLVKKLYSYKC